jgi:drug/metabolite transporter (DMT)-like permease
VLLPCWHNPNHRRRLFAFTNLAISALALNPSSDVLHRQLRLSTFLKEVEQKKLQVKALRLLFFPFYVSQKAIMKISGDARIPCPGVHVVTLLLAFTLAAQQPLSSQAFAPLGLIVDTPAVVKRKMTFLLQESRFKADKGETGPSSSSSFDPFLLSDSTEITEISTLTDMQIEDLQKSQEKDGGLSIWAARGLLLLVAAIWGTNFASVKYLETLCFHPPCNHPPSEFAFARFGLAALVSFPLLINQRKDVILAGLECGIWITLGYVCQAVALADISSGKCAFICSLTVVFVPVVSAILYGKPIKPMNVAAAMVALAGVGVLEGMLGIPEMLGIQAASAQTEVVPSTANALASSSLETASAIGPIQSVANALGVQRGDILALGQPIGFGYSFCRIEHYQEKFENVPNRVLTIAAAQCVAAGFLSMMWVLSDYQWHFPDFGYLAEPHRVATIAWTGMVTTVFAIFLEGIALQKATATDAAITFSSEPVWASLFGLALLNEQLGATSYVGGAIIMMACLIGSVSDLGEEEKLAIAEGAVVVDIDAAPKK